MIIDESIGRDLLRLLIWYPVRWLVFLLPLRTALSLFRLMGDANYVFSRGKKHLVRRNMFSALGDALDERSMARAVRGYFRNHYVNQLQIFLFPRLTKRNVERIHRFKGIEHLDAALASGKGCILIHPHFGPAQMPLCALGVMGYPVMQLGLLTDDGLSFIGRTVAFRLRIKYEKTIPAKLASADAFLRPVMAWVRENKVLMMTGDGAGGGRFIGKFIRVPFLGRQALFPVGAAILSLKTGAPLLPLFTTLSEDGTYLSVIHEPITAQSDDGLHSTIELRTGLFAKIMETHMLRDPSLWHFWDEWTLRTGSRPEEVLKQ